MKIGIISGAGTYTGACFYKNLIKNISKQNFIKKDSDFPYIKLINFPFKSLDYKGVNNNDFLKVELIHCLSKIKDCDIIIVYCISFHKILKELKTNNFTGKIIYLDELLPNKKKSLLLCSNTSLNNNIINEYKGTYFPMNKYYLLNNTIKNVIKSKTNNKKFNIYLKKILKERKIKTLILGCTELFCYNFKLKKIKIYNPEKKLIKNLIKEIKNEILSRKKI